MGVHSDFTRVNLGVHTETLLYQSKLGSTLKLYQSKLGVQSDFNTNITFISCHGIRRQLSRLAVWEKFFSRFLYLHLFTHIWADPTGGTIVSRIAVTVSQSVMTDGHNSRTDVCYKQSVSHPATVRSISQSAKRTADFQSAAGQSFVTVSQSVRNQSSFDSHW